MYSLPKPNKIQNELLYKLINENSKITKTSTIYKELSKKHWDNIAKPLDSLGEFELIFQKLSAITESSIPNINEKCIIVMCADNGVVEEGISQSDKDVTLAVAKSMAKGTSSISVLSRAQKVKLIICDIGIDSEDKEIYSLGVHNYKLMHGTNNFLKMKAIPFETVLNAVFTGIKLVNEQKNVGINIIGTGEMGIGNTTTSTALASVLLNISPDKITGKGAGLDNTGVLRKINVIKKGIDIHKFNTEQFYKCLKSKNEHERIISIIDLISSIGGLDIAAMTGIFLGGALYKIPVVIDGVISEIAALIAYFINPLCSEYMIASHLSKEPVADEIFDILKLKPVINASLALGEGSGCALMFPLLDLISEIYQKNASFVDIEIEEYKRFL